MNVYKVGLNEQAQNIRRLDRRLKNILDLVNIPPNEYRVFETDIYSSSPKFLSFETT